MSSFPSPKDVVREKDAAQLAEHIEVAGRYALSECRKCHYDGRREPFQIAFHSTRAEAVEQVVYKLESAGWRIHKKDISPGHFSHYLWIA